MSHNNPKPSWHCVTTQWNIVPWAIQKHRYSTFFDRASCTGPEAMLTLLDEAAQYNYLKGCLVDVLGYVLVNAPRQWFDPQQGNFVHALGQRVAAYTAKEPGVDYALIALCSGHGPNTCAEFKDIKTLGKHFLHKQKSQFRPDANKNVLLPKVDSAGVNAMLGLYPVNSIHSLYKTVLELELHRLHEDTPQNQARSQSLEIPEL